MNKKLVTVLASATLLVLPITTFALGIDLGTTPTTTATGVVGPAGTVGAVGFNTLFDKIFGFIWPLFIGFAIIMFLVAGFQFLTAQGDPTKVDGARQSILWGIVGVAMGVFAFSLPFIVKTAIGNI